MDAHAGNCTHGSLNYLGTITVSCSCGTDDVVDAKPVAQTDDGAKVAWVLNTVECQCQFIGRGREWRVFWDIEHGKHILWSLQETCLLHLFASNLEAFLSKRMGIVVLLPPLGGSYEPVATHC